MKTVIDKIATFARDEEGAVTIDYVVLAAGIVALATVIGTTIMDSTETAAEGISIGTSAWTTSGG